MDQAGGIMAKSDHTNFRDRKLDAKLMPLELFIVHTGDTEWASNVTGGTGVNVPVASCVCPVDGVIEAITAAFSEVIDADDSMSFDIRRSNGSTSVLTNAPIVVISDSTLSVSTHRSFNFRGADLVEAEREVARGDVFHFALNAVSPPDDFRETYAHIWVRPYAEDR